MKTAPARRWAAGLISAAALVVGTTQFTSAAEVAAPRLTGPAATSTTPADYPRVGQPNLYTHRPDRLSQFYQRLGFVELFRFTLPDGTVAFVSLQSGPFFLTLSHFDVIKQATGLRVLGYSARKQSDVTVIVADVDATVARMRSHGAKVLVPPMDQPWGERQAFITDPDGGLVQISTHNG